MCCSVFALSSLAFFEDTEAFAGAVLHLLCSGDKVEQSPQGYCTLPLAQARAGLRNRHSQVNLIRW
jgi:hypothetical protein